MDNWYDDIDRLQIKTTIHLEGGGTVEGNTHTDPATLEHTRDRCPDKSCSGTRFGPHVVNKVASMTRARETTGSTQSQCDGSKWKKLPGDAEPANYTCGNYAVYDIFITYKPLPAPTPAPTK